MKLMYAHNNAYDTIILVDDEDKVVSTWEVTGKEMADYLTTGHLPDDWDVQDADGKVFDGEPATPEDYGDILDERGGPAETPFAHRVEFFIR